jgi:ribosomal protein S18 acetylase RimI-like enzyme
MTMDFIDEFSLDPPAVALRHAESPADFEELRTLLRQYAEHLNATTAGGEHICLESYEKELASLPGAYSRPEGALLLAYVDEEAAGCVALKPLLLRDAGERACELKRLWVKPRFRGLGVGRRLAQAAMDYAAEQGYLTIYLDTIPAQMEAATELYRKLGFEPTERYRTRELFSHLGDEAPEVIFFRRSLAAPLP